MDNMQEFINKVLIPKLGGQSQMAQVMRMLYQQIASKLRHQKSDWDLKESIMKNQIEQDMAPFGFLNDGLSDDSFVDAQGDRWSNASVGEYGDMSYMWDYN